MLCNSMENLYVKMRNNLFSFFFLNMGFPLLPGSDREQTSCPPTKCHRCHHLPCPGQGTLASVCWAGLSLPQGLVAGEAPPLFHRLGL